MRFYGKRSGPEIISAQEIACFVYCPEAWRLQHGLGLKAANRAALNPGVGVGQEGYHFFGPVGTTAAVACRTVYGVR